MRVMQYNLSASPQKFYDKDNGRTLVMVRNRDAAIKIYIQFGKPSDTNDGMDILPGDTFIVEKNLPGHMSEEIYLWCDPGTTTSNVKCMVG